VCCLFSKTQCSAVTWDAILIIRHDLIFKRPMGDVAYDKVMFPFREWELMAGHYVADTIHYWPWKYTNCATQEGFREHFSGGVKDRIGSSAMSFLTKELHDANSMADKNPIYKMCRPEQKFEINGGFAIAIFGLIPPSRKDVEESGGGVCRFLYLQAEPRSLAATDIVVHSWVRDDEGEKDIDDVVELRYGQHPAGKQYERLPSSLSNWSIGFKSMKAAYKLLKRTPIFVERSRSSMVKVRREFNFDRIVFARSDYTLKSVISIYDCDTESEVCLGFGDGKFPVIIISVQPALQRFFNSAFQNDTRDWSDSVGGDGGDGDGGKGGGGAGKYEAVRKVFEKAFNLSVKVLCTLC